MGSGCGLVCRFIASDSRDPLFESRHRKFYYFQLFWMDKNKEKEAGNERTRRWSTIVTLLYDMVKSDRNGWVLYKTKVTRMFIFNFLQYFYLEEKRACISPCGDQLRIWSPSSWRTITEFVSLFGKYDIHLIVL